MGGASRDPRTVTRPMDALRVVDATGVEGAMVGKVFADLGADVIKVEPPDGDPGRRMRPSASLDGGDAGLAWLALNTGKRSVTANLHVPEGVELLRKLVESADVLVEAFPPGLMDDVGLGFKVLREENPGLIVVSLSAFGQAGPYSGRHSSDLVNLAMSGYLHMTGEDHQRPIKPSVPLQSYFHGSMHGVVATMLALRNRKATGKGSHVDVAFRESGIWMLTHVYQHFELNGTILRRRGAARDMGESVRLRTVFRSSDGYVVWMFVTGHVGKRSLDALVDWMSRDGSAPDWLQQIDWAQLDLSTTPDLTAKLDAVFSRFFQRKSKGQLLKWAIENGVMLGASQSVDEVLDDPQLRLREVWRELALLGSGTALRFPADPVKMGRATWEPRGTAPVEGADNEVVYCEELGISSARLQALARVGAV